MSITEIKESLKRAAGGAEFITATQVGKCLGIKNKESIRNKYLSGLEKVDGKYYLISDVAHRIIERTQA